jgi:hypothetical protein
MFLGRSLLYCSMQIGWNGNESIAGSPRFHAPYNSSHYIEFKSRVNFK